MHHNQRSHAWEGSKVTPENIVLTGQKDFFYRLVGLIGIKIMHT